MSQCTPDCGVDGLPCGNATCRKKNLVHLPACQIVQYKPRPEAVGYELSYPACASNGYTPPTKSESKSKSKSKKRKNPYMPTEWQGQQGQQQWARY